MEFKTLTIEELKRDYMDRHGFVFAGNAPSSRDSCDKLCQAIIQKGIAEVSAEFVVELNPSTFAFVYPEGVSFKSGEFFQTSQHMKMMIHVFQLDTLNHFLKNN